MNIGQLISICDAYAKLGWAVQETTRNAIDGTQCVDDMNPNARALVADWLDEVEKNADRDIELQDDVGGWVDAFREGLEAK